MPAPVDRYIELVHHVSGRTRFRLSWLPAAREEARQIAYQLSEQAGMIEVRVRPRTGGVLCFHEPTLEPGQILDRLRRITGVDAVHGPGERPPARAHVPHQGSAVGSAMITLFWDLDRDIARVTEGQLNLASLAVVGFGAAGTLNTLVTGDLPLPPWYSLAWWSFRVLETVEVKALKRRGQAGPEAGGSALH